LFRLDTVDRTLSRLIRPDFSFTSEPEIRLVKTHNTIHSLFVLDQTHACQLGPGLDFVVTTVVQGRLSLLRDGVVTGHGRLL
jgi:hypothetical protein